MSLQDPFLPKPLVALLMLVAAVAYASDFTANEPAGVESDQPEQPDHADRDAANSREEAASATGVDETIGATPETPLKLAAANLVLRLDSATLLDLATQQLTEVAPVSSIQDEMVIRGEALINAEVSLRPAEIDDGARFTIRVLGNVNLNAFVTRSPVHFQLHGRTPVDATALIDLPHDPRGLTIRNLDPLTTLTSVHSDPVLWHSCVGLTRRAVMPCLIRRVANRQISRELPSQRSLISEELESGLARQLDETIESKLAELPRSGSDGDTSERILSRVIDASRFQFQTSAGDLLVHGFIGKPRDDGVDESELDVSLDTMRIHETALSELLRIYGAVRADDAEAPIADTVLNDMQLTVSRESDATPQVQDPRLAIAAGVAQSVNPIAGLITTDVDQLRVKLLHERVMIVMPLYHENTSLAELELSYSVTSLLGAGLQLDLKSADLARRTKAPIPEDVAADLEKLTGDIYKETVELSWGSDASTDEPANASTTPVETSFLAAIAVESVENGWLLLRLGDKP